MYASSCQTVNTISSCLKYSSKQRLSTHASAQRTVLMAFYLQCFLAQSVSGLLFGCRHGCDDKQAQSHDGPKALVAKLQQASKMQETKMVDSIEELMPSTGNVVWAATLPIAWKTYAKTIGEHYRASEYEKIAESLLESKSSLSDLAPNSYHIEMFRHNEQASSRFSAELQKAFPEMKTEMSDIPEGGFVIYALLAISQQFRHAFFNISGGTLFRNNERRRIYVQAFGFGEEHSYKGIEARRQVAVLFNYHNPSVREHVMPAYALDLDRHSSPYQVVIARIQKGNTLLQMYRNVVKMTEEYSRGPKNMRNLPSGSELVVPVQSWAFRKRVNELERGGVARVIQWIDFKMNRKRSRCS